MDGIQAFILERPFQVRKDGTDWIYTAAVHCLYKGSTMSIRAGPAKAPLEQSIGFAPLNNAFFGVMF